MEFFSARAVAFGSFFLHRGRPSGVCLRFFLLVSGECVFFLRTSRCTHSFPCLARRCESWYKLPSRMGQIESFFLCAGIFFPFPSFSYKADGNEAGWSSIRVFYPELRRARYCPFPLVVRSFNWIKGVDFSLRSCWPPIIRVLVNLHSGPLFWLSFKKKGGRGMFVFGMCHFSPLIILCLYNGLVSPAVRVI